MLPSIIAPATNCDWTAATVSLSHPVSSSFRVRVAYGALPFFRLCALLFPVWVFLLYCRVSHQAFAPPILHRLNISTCMCTLSSFEQTFLHRRYRCPAVVSSFIEVASLPRQFCSVRYHKGGLWGWELEIWMSRVW